ncbi:MAG: bifunctional UDP-N-acetylmuramoyl-tripeptide:D-alanyl-D-alanine ligase/alanine racemase [Cyclobacteriaceae bacterium]|nr:MAG: bifunctional UDP-N-acetylmuramoyl-tripeptide:D-alanyl-D-alanine ligase/alanine racemase [Cyclobacteriaceae bacterium]
MLKISDLPQIMNGQILHLTQDHSVSRLLTDSRQLVVHPEAIFFAIHGENHDGHQYLEQVLSQNVVNFVVERSGSSLPTAFSKANVIVVKNSIRALQALSAFHRSKFDIPIIGITGSNAKTIIKEWLFQLLDDQHVVKSPKSYNSQIGVPLSVWQLNTGADLGIFEAGISRKGEMEHLAEVIRPTIGIFTNIGTAHDAGFADVREKIREKCILFRESSTIIYRKDHVLVHEEISKLFPDHLLFGWSTKGGAKLNFILTTKDAETTVRWEFPDPGQVILPFVDNASVENALHCLAFLLSQGYATDHIQRRVGFLQNIPHRLALKQGVNNCYLVDDTYNNDYAGLGIALDFLNQQPHGKGKVLILSDIKQASGTSHSLYQSVAERIRSYGINRFFGIGENLEKHRELFPPDSEFFSTTEDFLEWMNHHPFENQLILIKGARVFTFENIVQQLLRKHHGTVLEINLDALAHNLNFFRKKLPAKTKLMVMVKAFAYGTGSHEVANLLQYHGVDYLGVAYTDEGVDLRKRDITIPIMVMNPTPDDFSQLVDYQLEPEIYSLELLDQFKQFCIEKNIAHNVHIKIDTGMHRLGFDLSHIDALASSLTQSPLKVVSVFSHLAAADDPNQKSFSKQQFEVFKAATEKLEGKLDSTPLKHILNSAGILYFPEFHLDMVRLGIGLYGIGPEKQLRGISSLKTTISQIKTVPRGETVGYNRRGLLNRSSKIATIAIGYADGYDRRFGNGTGTVLVGDKLAPVVGDICMDMTMIDITDCIAKVGDQVIIFNDEHSVQHLSERIGTIPYELFTKISERVKRVYYVE